MGLCVIFGWRSGGFSFLKLFTTPMVSTRSELSSPSPELGKLKRHPPKCTSCSKETINGSQCCLAQPSRGLAELTSNGCATPPSTRRRIFLPKNLRNPFSIKRHIATVHDNSTLSGLPNELNTSTTSNNSVTTNNSSSTELVVNCRRRKQTTVSATPNRETNKFNRLSLGNISMPDDEGGNVKPVNLQSKSHACQDELQVRLGFFLENNPRRNLRAPIQSCSSLTSANTSPISTLTGSSEADVSRVTQESGQGCDSIGSLMSVSISEQSNASSSPLSRRHSVTTAQAGQVEELSLFKNRKLPARRSARSGQVKGPVDPRVRFAQFRQPQINLKPIFFEVPSQESDPLFIGRQWLIRELTTTIAAPECTGILINGTLGTGKTALMLQLVDYSCFGRRKDIPDIQENDGIYCQINVAIDRIRLLASHVVAYHFCQAEYNTTCFIPDFIHSIAAQMCQAPSFMAYHEFLLSEAHLQNVLTMKECIADPERAIKQGILEPLSALRRLGKIPAKNYVILIDALCEAEFHKPDHGDTIASFLARIIEYFPPWLKVIATVRTQMMEFTKCLPFSKISLDAWTSNDSLQKDMLDYISYRVNHSPSIQGNVGSATKDSSVAQLKFTQHLLGLSRGSFLFGKLTLDLIERRNLVIKSTSYKVLPVSLAQIYLLSFNLRFPSTTAYDKVMPILSVCLAALYPLTLVEIFYSVNALLCELPLEWEDFLDRFKSLTGFLIKRLDNTYMFFHPSFREWLIRRDEGESSKFLIDLRTGHAAIAFRLCRLQIPLDSEQTLELGHHILKAHLYRNAPSNQSPRDLQAFWVANATKCASSALCTLRNVYNPNVKVSRLLLLAGASPDHITPFLGNAPVLCIAAHEGVVPMVSLLLEYEADVMKTNSQGCTPLIFAAAKGHTDVVRQLVAAGSAVGQVDITQRSALVHAATFGHLKVVKYLIACDWKIRENSNDIGLKDSAQQACIVAAGQGHTDIVEELLDMSEVEVDAVGVISGETALTSAAMNGHTDTLALLLSRGANCDVRNRKELSPLLLAVKEGHWGIVERLLQNHATIEQTDMNGKTALMIAAEEGHVGIIELLLSKDANLDKADNDGLTALCWACLRGKLQAAKRLLEEKADKQHADNTGRTPLDLAAYQGSAALVQLLIDSGAQIEHVDINGMRPLDRAIACRNVQVVQVFLKRGAKLGPATWAMAAGKAEIMLILLNKLLEDGNTLYRKNRLQEASHRYQYALKKIPVPEQQIESAGTFQQLKFNFLLNLSRCKRKMNDASEAIDLATQAIELKPHSYDGFYARAKALLEVNNIADALKNAKNALERSKNQSIEVKDALIRLHEELTKRNIANSRNPIYTELTDL
uniref:CSON010478 protein n=1 Tax=Culicoides sonorensis TaxID=179676 RepID=A0A336KHD6_CULSO